MYVAILAGAVSPQQPIWQLKPKAMDAEPTESALSTETANRLMFSDMSGLLSGKPDSTTPNAQVANTCLPA
jgi:hypothetical protein